MDKDRFPIVLIEKLPANVLKNLARPNATRQLTRKEETILKNFVLSYIFQEEMWIEFQRQKLIEGLPWKTVRRNCIELLKTKWTIDDLPEFEGACAGNEPKEDEANNKEEITPATNIKVLGPSVSPRNGTSKSSSVYEECLSSDLINSPRQENVSSSFENIMDVEVKNTPNNISANFSLESKKILETLQRLCRDDSQLGKNSPSICASSTKHKDNKSVCPEIISKPTELQDNHKESLKQNDSEVDMRKVMFKDEKGNTEVLNVDKRLFAFHFNKSPKEPLLITNYLIGALKLKPKQLKLKVNAVCSKRRDSFSSSLVITSCVEKLIQKLEKEHEKAEREKAEQEKAEQCGSETSTIFEGIEEALPPNQDSPANKIMSIPTESKENMLQRFLGSCDDNDNIPDLFETNTAYNNQEGMSPDLFGEPGPSNNTILPSKTSLVSAQKKNNVPSSDKQQKLSSAPKSKPVKSFFVQNYSQDHSFSQFTEDSVCEYVFANANPSAVNKIVLPNKHGTK